jgi:hypothetical protein
MSKTKNKKSITKKRWGAAGGVCLLLVGIYFLAVLEFELTASCFLDRWSYHLSHSTSPSGRNVWQEYFCDRADLLEKTVEEYQALR